MEGRTTIPDPSARLNEALAGRYEVERPLGSGGMATVFLARDLRHRRPVAIKVLDPELSAMLGPDRFLREIETTAGFTHPHIVPLYDSGNAGGLLYYVMPYVEGESLRGRLAREAQLPVREAVQLASEVASALDYAHRRGVVHRDIKPENILLAEGGAMVADFGIARAIVAAGTARLTQTGVTIGTPFYMSPEQATGSATLDGRSDVYSLACVLYEMLSGQPPFTGPTGENVLHQHLHLSPRPVSALRTTVPAAVEHALETALAKAPADRFGTASAFVKAIAPDEPYVIPGSSTPAKDLAPTTTPGPSPAPPIPATGATTVAIRHGRGRGPVGIAAIAGLLVLALGLWQFGPWRPGANPPAPAKRAWMLVSEFDGPAEDSAMVVAIRDLVISGLEQSGIVAVVPRDQTRLALEMAGKSPRQRVDAETAREIAYRTAVRTVLEGNVGRLGAGYSVVLRVVDVDSARSVVSVSEAVADDKALIPALGRATKQLREKLGEQRASIQATRESGAMLTSSLEAFKAAQRARQLLFENDNVGGIAWARRALELDPDFAQCWSILGFAFGNLSEPDSAAQAFRRALARPDRQTPRSRLFARSSLAELEGDLDGALAASDQMVQLYPEIPAVHNNRSVLLWDAGRFLEALEATRQAARVSPFGPNQQILSNQFTFLLRLGRVDEAREVESKLLGSNRLRGATQLAAAAGDWAAAEDSASAMQTDPAAFENDRSEARAWIAAAQASSGRVGAADRTLLGLQSESWTRPAGSSVIDPRWGRLQLAMFAKGIASVPAVPGARDSTTAGLLAGGAWAAAAGDTVLARRLLANARTRPAPELARQGAAPAIVEGWIAARGGRWQEVVRLLGRSALQGEPIGLVDFSAVPLCRWLVAEAYEQLGQPDSAAAYFERAIAPPPLGGWSYTDTRTVYSFGQRRLALLRARMSQREEAEEHWRIFARTFTRPDPELRPWLAEAKAALAGGAGAVNSAGH